MVEVTKEGLRAEAARAWEALPTGAVVWLEGELGVGKTTFVRCLTQAAGATSATSPTFSLVHEYETSMGPVVHVDCYRLRDPDEAIDVDFPELQRRARMLLIEWPERAGRHAPPADLIVRLAHTTDAERRAVSLHAP